MILTDKANLLTVGFSTTNENFNKAVDMFKNEWKNYAQNGFSKEDVDFAKDYLIASYNLRFASILGIADILVMQQKMDLGLDFLSKRNEYVKNVSVEDVNKAAKKYFTDKLLQAQIGIFESSKEKFSSICISKLYGWGPLLELLKYKLDYGD